MYSRRLLINLTWIVCLVLAISCARNDSPLSPAPDKEPSQTPNLSPAQNSARHCWGFWQIRIDAKTSQAEVIPLRTTMNHLNTLPFLEKSNHSTIKLKDIVISGPSIELNVGLTHPFPGLYQWSGFDVRGIFITDGSYDEFKSNGDLVMSNPSEPRLLNADGWTRWWNPDEFPKKGTILGYCDGLYGPKDSQVGFRSTLNPFKYFADDLTQNEQFPAGLNFDRRGIFLASSSVNYRHYSIWFGNPQNFYIFNYAVDACHQFAPGYDGTSIPTLDQLPDPFFPTEANQPEAFAIECKALTNTLYYASPTQFGGDLVLSLNIYDWQGLKRPGGTPAEIDRVLVESPTLLGTTIKEAMLLNSLDPVPYSTYHVDIIGAHPDGVENQEVLITVISKEGDYKNGYDNYPTGFTGGDSRVCAYQLFVPVVSPEAPTQNATITVISPNGGEVWPNNTSQNITWTWTGSIPNVRIQYSSNGGGNWLPIDGGTGIVPNTGLYQWSIPGNLVSSNMLIRIADAVDGDPVDQSDAVFTITSGATITVTSPNGGEVWAAGSNQTITWTWTGNFPIVQITYSTTGPDGPWFNVGGGNGQFSNNGSCPWTVPTGSESTNWYIQIADASDFDPLDKSNAAFSVGRVQVTCPNTAADKFEVNKPKNITWNTFPGGNTLIQNVKIEFSKTGATGTYTTLPGAANVPNTGSWSWTPSITDITTQGRIKISSVTHPQLTDISDVDFEVFLKDELTLPEYKSYFTKPTTYNYVYRGRRTNLSSVNSFLSSSVTNWDFTTGTLLTLITSSTTFNVQVRNGSAIPLYGGAPNFFAQEYAMHPYGAAVAWPTINGIDGSSVTPDPWWVYYFDDTPNILNPSGFTGYFDGAYLAGYGWMILRMATHQWTLSESSDVQFPLSSTSGNKSITDTGLMYYNFSSPFSINYNNSGFDVISSGNVKVPQGGGTNYPKCLLIRHRHGAINPQSNLGFIAALMWQWVDMDSGKIVAFIMTHNDTQFTRFNPNNGQLNTEGVIGALLTE